MAAARAVWQRTVNRCFVQEDSKRAPKLTYYQSSSSTSSTKQAEDSASSQASLEPPQNPLSSAGFMPLHRTPNFPDLLPHNNRLWSHHHHPFQVNKNSLETEVNNQNISENKPEPFNSESFQEFIEMMETRESYGSIEYDESPAKGLHELPFGPISPWNPLSSEKAGPWWRTTDKDELASLVAQRSLDYVENCDLPTPQKVKHSYYSSCKNRTDVSSQSDLSNSKLLEALRHSQTRAREAENMATEANAEKEHLVNLLFKQASELFGYKQLLQLLHLETLYLKIKNKKSNEPPVSISWSRKPARKRRSKRGKPNAAKYLFGIALGLSLVGAGLILGWTVGWMQILSF